MHEETFIGSSPRIIKFDDGQILDDSVDLSSGVLRVACMVNMQLLKDELGVSLMVFDKSFTEFNLEG